MAQNKNALIRYKTIDKCLQNHYRRWTLENLIEACNDALYEYEGKKNEVSKRTVQLDIQTMRSEKLGYNAPIEVYEKKYYRYDDQDFSITDIPLTETDLNVLSETVSMLKQFKDFSLFSDVTDILQRLEDKIYAEKSHTHPVIHLDKNENLKGIHFLDELYQSIIKKVVLVVEYQSFRARSSNKLTIHPYILKEFNNRWFLVGKVNNQIQTLALDRISSIDYDFQIPYLEEDFNGDEYYKNTIGVTVLKEIHVQNIILKADSENAPYIITKPFHHTQEIIEQHEDGSVTFQIEVHLNFELERLILGFGESIEVLAPKLLRKKIKNKLSLALGKY